MSGYCSNCDPQTGLCPQKDCGLMKKYQNTQCYARFLQGQFYVITLSITAHANVEIIRLQNVTNNKISAIQTSF